MYYREHPEFEVTGFGNCDNCFTEKVDLCHHAGIGLCKYCWENEATICNICGEVYVSDSIDFHYDEENDILICEYCHEDMQEDEEEPDED